jgi:2-methylene-furan-3-one reductase
LFPDAQLKSKQGVLAEYITLPQDNLQKRPSNVSPLEAAGVCLAALTALQSLDLAKLEQDQTILINGGSTAVGSYAIQLAKIRGARVVATASARNEKFVRDLGADEVSQRIPFSSSTYIEANMNPAVY